MVATATLARVDNERLQRGVEGLASGAYAITLTRFTEDEVSAYVSNGDGKQYSVTLTAARSFCGCNDAMFRGKTCKHSVALALYVIRTPETERAMEAPTAPELAPGATTEAQPLVMPKLAKTRPGWAFSA